MILIHSPKFFVGDPIRVKTALPVMSNHAGLIRRIFRPTPDKAREWRYLVMHKGRRMRQGKWTKGFVHAYNESEIEAL
jgi:hypothetical protein